jgi:hypothetical protein
MLKSTPFLIFAFAVWFSNFQSPNCRAEQTKRPNILYDLANDPLESRNLINDPAQKQNIEQLSKQLAELMAETGITVDKMPLDEGIKENLPDKAIR